MGEASRPEIYPRYCFHLSPTVNTWCLLRAAELHRLEQHASFQGENFFFHENLPVKWVRVVGVVVAIDDFAGRRVYTVDDSSGACIEALVTIQKTATTAANEEQAPYQDIDVGAVVDVKGALSLFRDEKQIKVEKMSRLRCTAQEVALWEKRARFRRDVLEKPWLLQDRDIRRCRKEAERSEADAQCKAKRHRALLQGDGLQTSRHGRRQADATESKNKDRAQSDVAACLRDMIRAGAMEGKFDALGL